MSTKRYYNKEFLEKFCDENDIKYEDIGDRNIDRDIKIKGHCKTDNCDDFFEKTFRILVERSSPYCKKCTIKNGRKKFKDTCKEKFGVENPFQSENIKDKIKENNLIKYGVEFTTKLDSMKEKTKETSVIKYGTNHPTQSEKVKQKNKDTCVEKYGVENVSQLEFIKNKKSETTFIKSGVKHHMLLEEVKDKIKDTCFEKYGFSHPMKNQDIKDKLANILIKIYGKHPLKLKEIRDKISKTNMKKYNVHFTLQYQKFKDKAVQTFLKKYGVRHPMHNSKIAEKCFENAYKSRDFLFPSGKVIKCQGYEPYALSILVELGFEKDDIVTSKIKVPEIWYEDENNKEHRYYVDIFIKSLSKFIEVKSTWTYKKDIDKINRTKERIIDNGFIYECWIISSKGELLTIL